MTDVFFSALESWQASRQFHLARKRNEVEPF